MARKAFVAGIALLGAATGLYWAGMIGAAEAGQFTQRQVTAMYVSCPVILTIFLNFWLVPLCNGLLYGSVAYGVLALLRTKKSN
jgi:hypothetical protein